MVPTYRLLVKIRSSVAVLPLPPFRSAIPLLPFPLIRLAVHLQAYGKIDIHPIQTEERIRRLFDRYGITVIYGNGILMEFLRRLRYFN